MERLGRPFPFGQARGATRNTADPDITVRVFKEPKDFVSPQSFPGCVLSFDVRVLELLEAIDVHQPENSATRVQPPVALSILERYLVPTPATCFNGFWPEGREPFAVEPVNVLSRVKCTDRTDCSR